MRDDDISELLARQQSRVDRKAKHIARMHSDVLARLAKSRFGAASFRPLENRTASAMKSSGSI